MSVKVLKLHCSIYYIYTYAQSRNLHIFFRNAKRVEHSKAIDTTWRHHTHCYALDRWTNAKSQLENMARHSFSTLENVSSQQEWMPRQGDEESIPIGTCGNDYSKNLIVMCLLPPTSPADLLNGACVWDSCKHAWMCLESCTPAALCVYSSFYCYGVDLLYCNKTQPQKVLDKFCSPFSRWILRKACQVCFRKKFL